MITGLREVKKFMLVAQATNIGIPQEPMRNSSDINRLLHRIHTKEGNHFQEFFYCIFMNRANIPTGYYWASMGGITGTVADPRLIIKAAALADCTSIVLSHNHPSGNLRPSRADEEITQKIKHAASYFDIQILDHIIINEEQQYYSFADEGIL